MSVIVKQTFYDWCIEHNRQDVLGLWDYDLNVKTPQDIGSQSNSKYWFKCPRGIHESELHYISPFSDNENRDVKCNKCNSIAQHLVDMYGYQGFIDRWSDRNTVDPWTINKNNKGQVWINCIKNPKHTHKQYVLNVYKGIICPYCKGRRVLPEESVGALYPKILDIWSDKNDKTPYEYSPHSNKDVWVKCPDGIHEDYQRAIDDTIKGDCGCAKCSRYSSGFPEDLTGVRFSRLTVVGRDPNDSSRWLCICDCQADEENPVPKSIARGHLTTGRIQSCGCYVKEIISGENHWNWKGGTSSESDQIRQSIEYRQWQNAVHKRDKYTCQCCGQRYDHIEVHHVYPFSVYENLRFEPDNGICLCKECHNSIISGSFHNLYGTYQNTPEQLREYILNKSGIDIYETHSEILSLNTTK